MTALLMDDRLRERVEAILPECEEHAISSLEMSIWLSTTPDYAAKACVALRRFGAADFRIEKKKHKSGQINRKIWWNPTQEGLCRL